MFAAHCTVSAVSWVCTGWSLGKADPIFIFGPLLTGLTPAGYSQSPPADPTSGPALLSHQMLSSGLADAHHAHGVGRHRLVAERGVQAGAGGWCLIGLRGHRVVRLQERLGRWWEEEGLRGSAPWSLHTPAPTSCWPLPQWPAPVATQDGREPESGAPGGCGPAPRPCCFAPPAAPGPAGSPAPAPGCCPEQPPASSPPAAHGPGGWGATGKT